MFTLSRSRLEQCLVTIGLAFLILWKGGKSVDATWVLGFLAIALTWIDMSIQRTSKRIPLTLWLLVIVFCGWTVLSFALSKTMNYGFDEVLQTCSLALVFFWAVRRSSDKADGHSLERKMAKVLSASLLIACGIGIAVYILQPVSRFVGSFFDSRFHTDYWPNAWGEFIVLAWPILAWVLWSTSEQTRKLIDKKMILRAIVFGLVIGCLLLSYSRGSLIACAVQAFVALVLVLFSRLRINLPRMVLSLVIVVAMSVLVFFSTNAIRSQTYPVESVIAKATFSSDEKASSISERSEFWHQAIALTKIHPIIGWGPYSFRFVQPQLQEDVLATADHPHNVLLKLAMERGIPAAILFALMLILIAVSQLHVLRLSRGHEIATRWFIVAVLVSINGVLAHNMIDYNLQFVGISLPFWLLAGFGTGISLKADERKRVMTIQSRVTFILSFILLAFLIIEGRYLYISSQGRHAEASGDTALALSYYDQTTSSLFSRDMLLSTANLHLKRGETTQAIQEINAYVRENHEDGRAWKLKGDSEKAIGASSLASYEEAYKRLKYDDVTVVLAYVTQLAIDDRTKLDENRHETDSLMNDYQLAVQDNVHFIDLSANVEALSELARVMGRLYPDDKNAYDLLSISITHKAETERAKEKGRPAGVLW